jgi:hypothetical protein
MEGNTKKMRATLAIAIERAIKGDLPYQDAKSLIGLANQISHSMAVEVKVREQEIRINGKSAEFGLLEI